MLENTRTLAVLAFADELVADPMALAAYAAAFREGDDATLVIYAPDRTQAQLVPALLQVLEAAGVPADAGPDILALAAPAGEAAERALADRVCAVYSRRPAAGAFGTLPRYDLTQVARLRNLVVPPPVAEEREGPTVPVVMCVWKRIEFLPTTIALLERQVGVRPELHLWVNNADVADEVRRLGAASSLRVHVTVSRKNVGGIGRFHVARELAAHHSYVVFIDDDQSFDEHALRVLLDEARPRTIVAQYAFQLECPHSYWHRRLPRPSDWVQYAGTGGMVADTSIFEDERAIACPDRFNFVEDLWLSYVAEHELGWRLVRSGARFVQVDDGRNQWSAMPTDLKSEFLRHLVDRGWRVPARPLSADARPWPQPADARCDCRPARAAA